MKNISVTLLAVAVGCAFFQPVRAAEGARFKEKVVWSFGSGTDGQYPAAGLTDENGTLYGTTTFGGAQDEGTVFSVDPGTGTETVLHSFCTKRHRYCLDGAVPLAALINVGGKLFGTTDGGGADCQVGPPCGGTVFSLNPVTGKEKLYYSFCGHPDRCMGDGYFVTASLLDVGGVLYGTTDEGGDNDFGVAFSIDLETGAEKRLHSFCSEPHCTDGRNSGNGLVAVNGTLYGTTVAGGANYAACENAGCGVIYALDPGTASETVVYSFLGGANDGWGPEGNLILENGLLYGVTEAGGREGCNFPIGCGTVFSFDPGMGAEKILYSFCQAENCADGALPIAGLVAANGKLYGTTISGGANGHGAVFSVDPATGAETVLYSFCRKQNCKDGSAPESSLINLNGMLYGTTKEGGAYGKGVVFALPLP